MLIGGRQEFQCEHCGVKFFRSNNRLQTPGRINPEKLKFCDAHFNICVICSNRHGKSGSACSPQCVKLLREKTNIELYGVPHNWNKSHPGRESYKTTMISKYGVEHNFTHGKLRKLQDENIQLKYGVDNVFSLPDVQEKIRKTNLEKFGVSNPSQCLEIAEKKIQTSYLRKEFTFPSGNTVFVQGYEPFALTELLQIYSEEQLIVAPSKMPEIWYIGLDGEYHRYIPDIFVPSENLIVEVKSDYFMNSFLEKNKLKRSRCIELGYNFKFMVYDQKMNNIDESLFLENTLPNLKVEQNANQVS